MLKKSQFSQSCRQKRPFKKGGSTGRTGDSRLFLRFLRPCCVCLVCFSSVLHAQAQKEAQIVFPSTQDTLPPDYRGPVFHLRQDYPTQFPDIPRPWEAINFKKEPVEYLNFIKQYLLAGMAEANYYPAQNKVHDWYHMPWLTTGRRAREAIHGLQRERDVKPFELDPHQTQTQQKWEVAYYNPIGAYQIGKIWKNPKLKGAPDLTQTEFPEGTLVFKWVFVTGDDTQLPILKGAPLFYANINREISRKSPKAIRPVRLVQMDFAIRDKRADETTSWVMGTYVYDKDAPGKTGWERMVPLGVQWGNDPGITPKMVQQGIKLKETIVLPNAPKYALERLGWGGRLNGPMDLRGSACLACHSMAQWPHPLNKRPKGNDQQKLKYFRNLKPTEPFDKGQISLDYSLQLENALRAYRAQRFKQK